MWIVWAAIGGVLLLVLLLVFVPMVVKRTLGPRLDKRIAAVYRPDAILLKDPMALSFGLTSRGVTQGRGNGALVLTPTTLHWFQFVPRRSDVVIPRDAIAEVAAARGHLGKMIGRDILLAKFEYNGKPDSMAWHVHDLEAWLAKLRHPVKAGTLA